MTVRQARTWSEALMGEVAPASKLRLLLRVAAVVLTLDVLSKVLAVALLEEGIDHWFGNAVSFRLYLNEAGHGSRMDAVLRRDGTARTFLYVLGLLVGLLFPLVFARAKHPPAWKAAMLLGVPFITLLLAMIAGLLMSVAVLRADVPVVAIRVVRAVAALTFWWQCLRLTRNKGLFVAAAMQFSAGVGNVGNRVVYPRGVIDFLWVPAFSPHLGVFNLADAAIELSFGLLLAYPLGRRLRVCTRLRHDVEQARVAH